MCTGCATENLSDKLVKDFGEFDPTLELANFKFPTFLPLEIFNFLRYLKVSSF